MRFFLLLIIFSAANALIATGQVTIDNSLGYDTSGFDLLKGAISGIEGDFYYYEGNLWSNNGGIKSMGEVDVSACDLTGYNNNIEPLVNNYYCIKTREGSYAKIFIKEKTSNSITFTWAHQRDGTNVLLEKTTELITNTDYSFNTALIVIIIVLIIVIFLIIKFR